MTIKDLRTMSGMTQQEFANYFEIPKRTIENWEGGQRKCPEYLEKLIEYKLIKEGYTLKLVEYNEGEARILTEGSLEDIVKWLKDNPDEYEWINERELETEALMGKDRHEPNLVSLDLNSIETLKDLENELSKIDLSWWTLVIE